MIICINVGLLVSLVTYSIAVFMRMIRLSNMTLLLMRPASASSCVDKVDLQSWADILPLVYWGESQAEKRPIRIAESIAETVGTEQVGLILEAYNGKQERTLAVVLLTI